MDSPFEAAASEARRQIQEHVDTLKAHPAMDAIRRLHPGLNAIEDMMQVPRTSLGALLGFGDIGPAETTPMSRVKFDSFVGLGTLDAAKRYLKLASDARPFQEIVDAVKAGGGKVDNEDNLRTGLSRSTLDIVKIADRYGLLEHYPNIKRGAKKRKETADLKPSSADSAGSEAVEVAEASDNEAAE